MNRLLLITACSGALVCFGAPAGAVAYNQNLIADPTFQNPIGVGNAPNPWSDWTNAGITTHSTLNPIIGNYASIPFGGDLFQRFTPLNNSTPVTYQFTFLARNQSNQNAALVFAFQQAFGTPISDVFSLGLGKEIYLPGNSGFVIESLKFTLANPNFLVNELTFSNSYDAPVAGIEDSINAPGTVIDIAAVSLIALTSGVPEPETWSLMILGMGLAGAALRRRRATRGPEVATKARWQQLGA